MGRSDTVTLLPIDRWAVIMTIFEPHFNGLWGTKAPPRPGCDEIWDQDARDSLAWAIQQAENLIATELGFQPAPAFQTEEELAVALTGVRLDWWQADLKTNWGYVSDYGTEQLTLVQADATVEYLDLDHDPLAREEIAEIGNSLYADLPACARPCDVAVFFRVADGAEDAADPRWEIKPLKVDIDGATMRIRAESSLFVRPDLWALTKSECVASGDPNAWIRDFNQTNFVTKVDVYCRTVNPQTPVTLQWDGVCTCSSPCSHRTQTACAYPTDKKHGFFIPRAANWNGTSNVYTAPLGYGWRWNIPPESALVSYRAGYPLDRNCRMDSNLERAIVKLANVLLPEPPCGFCDVSQSIWKMDRQPIDPLTPEAASMPWDLYAQGALEAWRIVKRYASGRGGKMGR